MAIVAKKAVKAPAKASSKPVAAVAAKPAEKKNKVGKISHFFDQISVAVIEVEKPISVGDSISIEGSTTNFKQKITSMQIDKKPVQKAAKGQSIGMKVNDKVRVGDSVYKE